MGLYAAALVVNLVTEPLETRQRRKNDFNAWPMVCDQAPWSVINPIF